MKLKDYLDRFCILPTHLARKMDFDPNKIFRIIRHGVVPSLTIALRIEDFTEGKVTCRDIFQECMSIKEKNKKKNKNAQEKNSTQSDE